LSCPKFPSLHCSLPTLFSPVFLNSLPSYLLFSFLFLTFQYLSHLTFSLHSSLFLSFPMSILSILSFL
jgi:hypothetical protein